MASGCVLHDTRDGVNDRVTDGCEVRGAAARKEAIKTLEQLTRTRSVLGEGGQRRPDLPHCSGGR